MPNFSQIIKQVILKNVNITEFLTDKKAYAVDAIVNYELWQRYKYKLSVYFTSRVHMFG